MIVIHPVVIYCFLVKLWRHPCLLLFVHHLLFSLVLPGLKTENIQEASPDSGQSKSSSTDRSPAYFQLLPVADTYPLLPSVILCSVRAGFPLCFRSALPAGDIYHKRSPLSLTVSLLIFKKLSAFRILCLLLAALTAPFQPGAAESSGHYSVKGSNSL